MAGVFLAGVFLPGDFLGPIVVVVFKRCPNGKRSVKRCMYEYLSAVFRLAFRHPPMSGPGALGAAAVRVPGHGVSGPKAV